MTAVSKRSLHDKMVEGEKPYINYCDRIIPIAQSEDGVCEVTCLTMLYRAFGEHVDEELLIGEVKPDLGMIDSKYFGGTLPEQAKLSAERHGYNVLECEDVSYNDLVFLTQQKKLPVLIGWMSDVDGEVESDYHASVITYADNEKVRMADPSYGEWRVMDRRNFERKWMGYSRNGRTIKHPAMIIWR